MSCDLCKRTKMLVERTTITDEGNKRTCISCNPTQFEDVMLLLARENMKLQQQLNIATKTLERINDRAPYSSVEGDYSIEQLVKEALDEMEKV